MDFVAIDFETANEQRDSACAIGWAVVENDQITSTAHHLIRPLEPRFHPFNVCIHGITEEMTRGAPTFAEFWPTIKGLVDGKLVVAHWTSFDISVLRYSLYGSRIEFPNLRYLCSVRVAKKAWPQLPSHNLDFLAYHHGIELNHHEPESDAIASAKLILLAGAQHSISCPFDLANRLEVNVGQMVPDPLWEPKARADRWVPIDETPKERKPPKPKREFPADTSLPLYGKVFAVTGTLRGFSREEAFAIVETYGGLGHNSVTRETNVLVTGVQHLHAFAGHKESSKLRKARELKEQGYPIEIIADADFQRLIAGCVVGEACDDLEQETLPHVQR